MIALEIQLPESLFRRVQQLLDAQPDLSFDDVFTEALHRYFPATN